MISLGNGAAVLLRAVEPIEGIETMYLHRKAHQKSEKQKKLKPHELCNGPSKLCMSLAIERFSCNKQDLSQSVSAWP
jgi:DNA-3-methyladenine glycosylase